MTSTATGVQALTVRTERVDDVRRLIPLLSPSAPLLWQRRGDGLAGLGEALRLTFSGPDRLTDAAAAWREIAAAAHVRDALRLPGTGLVAFGSFAFSASSAADSVLIVPSVIVGRRDGVSWVTYVSRDADAERAIENREAPRAPRPTPFGDEYRLTLLPGAQSSAGYSTAVEKAVARIADGSLEKVVLARDLRAHLPAGADLRRAIDDLALGYPDCWTFAIDGFLGASPETLVRVAGGALNARVLAGTAARGASAVADAAAAERLASSDKDVAEHGYAVASVLDALAPHAPELSAGARFTLKLPNLWHLATDVGGRLADGASALDLVAALHPTAAVAGTPREAALALIDELEPFDRGRYAGPVGWIGADGDGEWAVALRSAQLEASGDLIAYAGGGIVAGSDPVLELAETTMKFRPVVEAFG